MTRLQQGDPAPLLGLDSMETQLVFVAMLVFLLAGVIKGIAGIGLPTASLSLLVQFVDPRVAVSLLLVPLLVSNVWQVYRGGDIRESVSTLWPFALTCLVFTWIAANRVVGMDTRWLVVLLGASILAFVLSSFLKQLPRIPEQYDRWVQVGAGGLAGVLGGLTAIWGPPMIMYLLARRPSNDDFVRYTGFLFVVGSIPLTIAYWRSGLFGFELAVVSLLMVLPTLVGFAVGERIRPRLNGRHFRLFVLIFFAIMGLNLIRRAIA